uniref:Piwi domain-containing protein n=1 Tax=Pyramimonas obovata TaxID=1411642 RepID=A0A7S0MUQ9_9CHLO|mmetsp:Transcript_13089/g.27677  ORF Transcript_13089/g.27677 Transcript_13089/m.27677 type:complete len:135 (+) Transcript_13089:741-1145(+)
MSTQDKNPEPGTLVDDPAATHPEHFNFHLVSHKSIGGKTVKVPNYIMLWDENGWTVEDISEVCYAMCHLYGYCAMPVSLPPPVMYAHQVAARARTYLRQHDSDAGSSVFGEAPTPQETEMLPEVHSNVRDRMYW